MGQVQQKAPQQVYPISTPLQLFPLLAQDLRVTAGVSEAQLPASVAAAAALVGTLETAGTEAQPEVVLPVLAALAAVALVEGVAVLGLAAGAVALASSAKAAMAQEAQFLEQPLMVDAAGLAAQTGVAEF